MISPEIFYLHIQGEQRGPYTVPQIDHLLNSGLIAQETLYWREGLEQWQPVTTLVSLRQKANPWIKPALVLLVVLAVAFLIQLFGSVTLLGWREANQHEYTANGAYWRARSVVRSTALPPGTVVEFGESAASVVNLHPPQGAVVRLHGVLTDGPGGMRALGWAVPMHFDPRTREWTGGPPQEIAP